MTEQKSRLVIEISTENAKRNAELLNQEIQKLTEKGDKASASSSALGKELKTTGESAKTLGDSTSKATKELAQQESQLNKNGTAVVQLAKYVASYLTISKAISMADGYTQMAARIKNATANAQEYTLVQERLYQTANTTYRSLAEAQEVYLSMSGGMKSLGYNTAQTLDMTDSLSFAFTANATRADQAQSAMDALSKSMAKGKVDADAWISIVTGADNVIADMAKTTGKSEAAIRQLGATGKISLEDLIKTLIQTKDANEALANNMENSFADGMQKLSNAVTVYLGKTNESTSATGMLASALGGLADNLDAIADVAILGGVAYLTQAIASQTVAIKASVTSSFAKRAALTAELQSQATLAAVEVQRTRQVVALAATEVNLARAEYSSATTRNARAAATLRLTQAEVAYNIAAKQSTIATVAQTTAQNALNASQAIGARMLALVGGPIGALTLGVTALAAGYMYMQSRAEEANKKLQEQAKVAEETKEKLLALKGVELDVAKDDLAASFADQNAQLHKLNLQFNGFIRTVKNANEGNKEVKDISDQVHKGLMSQADAVERLNKLKLLTPEQRSQGLSLIKTYNQARDKAQQNAEAQKILGKEVTLAGNAAQNASSKFSGNTKELKENKTAAEQAAQAQKDYRASLYDREYEAYLTKGLLAKGYSSDQVKNMVETANWARKNNVKITNELYQTGLSVLAIEQKNNKVVEDRNKAEKELTKEKEKQLQTLKLSAQVQANAVKYNFSGLESKYGLPNGMLSALHAIETGNTGKTNQVNKTTGATGGFQFLEGTAKQYGVKDRTNLAQSAEGAAKYMAYLLKLFKGDLEKAVRAYHAGEGNVQKGTNIGKYNNDYIAKYVGYTAGQSGITGDFKDVESYLKEQYQLQLKTQQEIDQLKEQYSDADVVRSKKRTSEITEAEKLGQQALIPQINARYDAQDEIARLQLESELNMHKWTEEQKLQNTHDINIQRLNAEGQYSEQQKALVKKALDEQLAYELSAYKRLQQDKLNEFKWGLEQQTGELQRALIEAQAQLYLTPSQTAKWQLQNEYSSSVGGAWDSYQNSIKDVNKKDDKDQYINDAQTRHQMLLAAEQQYQDQLKLIKEKSVADDLLLLQQQQSSTMAGYSNMFGGIASLMQGFGDNSSATYRTMFALQKAFALSSAFLNSKQAILDAYANTPGNIWTKMAAAATAAMETGVMTAAIQAISPQGFSEGGYTGSGGKYEPAGVVHKGEVVFSQADIARLGGVGVVEALRKGQRGYSEGGVVGSPKLVGFRGQAAQPNVTINNYGKDQVETSTDNDGNLMITVGKMMDQKIDAGVDKGILRNLRQGHPLANAIKGR